MKKLLTVCVLALTVLVGCGQDKAKNGDTVIINFAGYTAEGVQFPGGTASGYPLTLGDGQFVPGFEEQVVGMKVGEERDVKITFPTEYYPELAGKDVVFKVTVTDIQKK